MNEVFIIGKIVTDIDFKFIINSKTKKSITSFYINFGEEQEVKIIAYNENADYCYRNLKKKDLVFLYSYIENNNIVIKEINKL